MIRKKISAKAETEVLVQSRRRCAMCFGLNSDFKSKRGQIAHVDHDKTNAKFENLAFLCQEHHDEYDSIPSQTKGIKPNELKIHRKKLYEFVIEWETDSKRSSQNASEAKSLSNNDFSVYKLINPASVCGYEYLTLNDSQQVYISLSDDHFSIDSFYWEVSKWLNCDYKKTKDSFTFDFNELVRFVNIQLFERDFSLTVYTDKSNLVNSLVFTFNKADKYYELDYSFFMKRLIKTADGFRTEIDLADSTDVDVLTWKGIIERLTYLNHYRLKLLSSNKI